MKNLKLKKLFALLLASAMCVSMTACGNEGGTSTGGDSTTSETPAVRTDETRFEELRTAIAATAAYQGDLTMIAGMSETQTSPDYQTGEPFTSSASMEGTASYNAADKTYYTTTTSTQIDGEETIVSNDTEKIFKSGDVYYSYEKSSQTPASDWSDYESYTKLLPRSVEEGFATITGEIPYLTEITVGNTFLADSYAELTSAYDTVYATALANSFVQLEADEEDTFNEEEGDSLNLTPTVTIADGEDGSVSLSLTMTLTTADVSEQGSINMHYEFVRTLTAKDGKVSAIGFNYEMEMSMTMPGETESATPTVQSQSMGVGMNYGFSYDFDQTGYDAIAVTLPAEEEIAAEMEDYSKDINVVLGNVSTNVNVSSYAETPSIADALSYIPSNVESNFEEYDWSTGESTKTVTVEGLYTDAALTTAVDPSAITEEEYFALETLYAKYTIDANYFAVSETDETVYQLSKPYQIVISDNSLFDSFISVDMYVYATENYAEGYEFDTYEEYDSVEVNGETATGASFTVEGGKTYSVVYKTVLTDADVTFEDILMGLIGTLPGV